jgi:hypothetical protein
MGDSEKKRDFTVSPPFRQPERPSAFCFGKTSLSPLRLAFQAACLYHFALQHLSVTHLFLEEDHVS